MHKYNVVKNNGNTAEVIADDVMIEGKFVKLYSKGRTVTEEHLVVAIFYKPISVGIIRET
jgi:hypothetical protein